MKVYQRVAGLAAALLAACAATPETRQEQALRDFVEVGELQEQTEILTHNRDTRDLVNKNFLVYDAKDGTYLIEFRTGCYDLVQDRIVPDKRWDTHRIRARFDTINGCIIDKIYLLTEAQSAEFQELAKATE